LQHQLPLYPLTLPLVARQLWVVSAPLIEFSVVSPHESAFSGAADTTVSGPSSSNTNSALENIHSLSTPHRVPSLTVHESTSPPLARASSRTPSATRTHLPYPTGDYTSPGDLVSPTHTPANSPPQCMLLMHVFCILCHVQPAVL